jgi:(p)ppGpp synthase/HD superfamily hydrolase
MDINTLDSFLDYKLDLTIKPQSLVDKIISRAEKYLGSECKIPIQKAYKFAEKAHKDQKRLS